MGTILSLDRFYIIPWSRHNWSRKGVCGNMQFLHGSLYVSYRSRDKSKNPCPCKNHTFPNIIRTWKTFGLWPHASQTLMTKTSLGNVQFLHRHGSLLYSTMPHPHGIYFTLPELYFTDDAMSLVNKRSRKSCLVKMALDRCHLKEDN